MATSTSRSTKFFKWTIICLVILGPCIVTFGDKLRMLIQVFQGDTQWAFIVTPVVNYLLASTGFVCLFIWAAMNGMFSDMEQPKLKMLATEMLLDQLEEKQQRPTT